MVFRTKVPRGGGTISHLSFYSIEDIRWILETEVYFQSTVSLCSQDLSITFLVTAHGD